MAIKIDKLTETSVLTIIPPKNEKRLVQNAEVDSYNIYVNSIEGLSVGSTVLVTSNTLTAPLTRTILSIDPVWDNTQGGFRITFKEKFATVTNITIANFARIFQQDSKNKEIIEWDNDDNIISVVDKININSKYITADDISSTAKVPGALAETYFQKIGTAPDPGTTVTSNELTSLRTFYQAVCTYIPDLMKDFINVNKVKIRLVYVDSPDANVHADFRDLAVTMRSQERSPICVIAGAGFGETSEALAQRGLPINSDDFVLCGGGADGLPANLTLAPAVLGIKMSYGINHNLTRDQLNFTSVERDWTNTEITKLLKAGILTYDKFPSGFRLVRGINTYQDQTHVWNVQDKKTYLQMPRDLADAFFRGLLEGLDNDLVGADQVTRKKVETYCVKTGNNFVASGLINDFKVLSIKRGEAGWLPEIQIEVDDPTDFFGTRIFVISPSLD
jgi:hypothetical protein